MSQNRKILRWLTVFFAVMLVCASSLRVDAATSSGRCGSKLYWSYDSSSGTLAFTGTGAMFTYANQDTPWFTYADQIRKITFESGITTICDRAFYGCKVLNTVTLPATVTSVGASAFENCVSLTSLPLSAGSCTVGEGAFRGCTGLQNITIPEGITAVGANAFEQCSQAQSLSIPKTLTGIGANAFRGCSGLQKITVATGNSNFAAVGNCLINRDGVLLLGSINSVIPTNGSVTTIGADAFRGITKLQTITIPNTVTAIEDYAFLGCTGLTQINLGTSLDRLGTGAFQGCSTLKSVVLPASLTEIGACAFSGCLALETVNFPEDLEILNSWSFANTAIKTVSLSDTVKVVGINPFRGCRALTSITVNYRNRIYKAQGNCLISSSDKVLVSGCRNSQLSATSVTTIGQDAFRDIDISSLVIPDTVQTIEAYAFAESALKQITFGAGLTQIKDNPLVGCEDLTSISVSAANTTYRATGNCLLQGSTLVAGCQNSTIGNGVTLIGFEAFSNIPISQITLPEGITHIGKRAFFGCTALKTVKLPNSLTTIAESAFELSGLEHLTIGTLPQIGSCAFLGCYHLKSIHTADAAGLEPGATENGYIAYYADWVTEGNQTPVLHYIGNELQTVYISMQEAIANYNGGWLQLGSDVQVNVTLKRDLYIDLAGFDMCGTVNTAGYAVYGMDSTTDNYTCQATGLFNCTTSTGIAVVPQRHFQSDLTGTAKRYMAIKESAGYSFHCFYIDIVYATINITRVGVGYKAIFRGDEKVISQLDPQAAFRYELCLKGNNPVIWSMPAANLVSGEKINLLIVNYHVQDHGQTPLSAWVSLKLADGTVIESDKEITTLRILTEYIDKHIQDLNTAQLEGLLAMMDTFPVMKSWDVPNLLSVAKSKTGGYV